MKDETMSGMGEVIYKDTERAKKGMPVCQSQATLTSPMIYVSNGQLEARVDVRYGDYNHRLHRIVKRGESEIVSLMAAFDACRLEELSGASVTIYSDTKDVIYGVEANPRRR